MASNGVLIFNFCLAGYFTLCLMAAVCHSNPQLTVFHDFNVGPVDLLRKIGEENVYIPCPFAGKYAQTWEINGVLYDQSNLPSNFRLYAYGLLINKIEADLDGTTYRCFYPQEDGTNQSSSLGTLGVVTEYE